MPLPTAPLRTYPTVDRLPDETVTDLLRTTKRIALVAPYMKPLTKLVVDYIEEVGIVVADYAALEISDNLEVGRHDTGRLMGIVDGLAYRDVDAIVLSACVQMPTVHRLQLRVWRFPG